VPAAFPPLRLLDALPHNLPLQLTGFVGRERELGEVAALLGTARLVTLTGPGGVGKTRLALQAAADTLEADGAPYPDGVWLAELGALAEPALVPAAVAGAVGVREEPGRPLVATLTDALRPRRLLLVLDNCEQPPGRRRPPGSRRQPGAGRPAGAAPRASPSPSTEEFAGP
jgi:hypothetical protein